MKPMNMFAAAVALTCSTSLLAQGTGQSADPAHGSTTGTQETMEQGATQPGTATTMDAQTFAAFDSDGDGVLAPLEFAQFLAASQAPAAGQPMAKDSERERRGKRAGNPAVQLLNETSDEFAMTDANHDRRIEPQELAMAMSGGAPAPSATMPPSTPSAPGGSTYPSEPGATMPSTPSMPSTPGMPTTPGTPTTPTMPEPGPGGMRPPQ